MKKLSFFLIIFFILVNPVFSEIPEFDYQNLNKNINEYKWKVVRTNFIKIKDTPIELYTLSKNGFILKCQVAYLLSRQETNCLDP